MPPCEQEDYEDDCPYDLALRDLDYANTEALGIYLWMQDQLTFIGMEGVRGPLPLPSLKLALEMHRVPETEWLGYIDRIRVLHDHYCTMKNEAASKRRDSKHTGHRPQGGNSSFLAVPGAKRVGG